jgi:EAL domain-containing protein (putative c-di-GMP-specific phosphodiesterase class I)
VGPGQVELQVAVAPPVSVASILAEERLRVVYQPIVDLDSRAVLGYEALARGPECTPLESPAALFAAARREGLTAELDQACRRVALDGAGHAGLQPSQLLFLNAEPAALDSRGVPADVDRLTTHPVSVVVELTERDLTARPSEVLATVRWLRERNCRIALDDVGADIRSLALMPFVAPDVIKLDMALVQDRLPPLEAARILNAVGAESERTGTVILAEGIETEDHLRRAKAIGATLGQGWLLGRPGRLRPDATGVVPGRIPVRPPAESDVKTPYEIVAPHRPVRRGDKRLLLSISRQLEEEALGLAGEVVVLATFQHGDFFTARTARRYRRLAGQAALVGALGEGMPSRPGGNVRGASLGPGDPLRGEWDVIVIAPHFAGAFVARDLGDEGEDFERRFDYMLSYDRELVTKAARSLLSRVVPTR